MNFLDAQEIRLLKVAILVAAALTFLAGCELRVAAADLERAQAACSTHNGLRRIVIDGYVVYAVCNDGLSALFAASKP